jgi:hypothetical protein
MARHFTRCASFGWQATEPARNACLVEARRKGKGA